MSNESRHHRPSRLPYIFLALSAFLAVSALSLLLLKSWNRKSPDRCTTETPVSDQASSSHVKIDSLDNPPKEEPIDANPVLRQTIPTIDASGGVVEEIARALKSGDLATIMRLTGHVTADPLSTERLKNLTRQLAVAKSAPIIRQVGEIQNENTMRWAVEFSDNQSMYLDLHRKDGRWVLDHYSISSHDPSNLEAISNADPLTVADVFLQSVIKQNFHRAKGQVLSPSITDAKIAGLCIIFEEGKYILPKDRPMRLALRRGDVAGYLVSVTNEDGSGGAQIGITLRQLDDQSWKIAEINLDNLLSDYAGKFAQGDVHYTPLVRNPAGGETLALYFDFDSGEIDPRACRQLEIVALVLLADPNRKIHISGHTDALGTDEYNQSLSNARADAVRDFLVRSGVPSSQVVMSALGASQPRRPNVTETGEDNPEGRRVNRRAEIYLDF